MTMQNGGRVAFTDAGAFQKTRFERWLATVRFTAAASAPWLTAGSYKRAWEDARSALTAGGIASQDWNNTLVGGKMPASKGVMLHAAALQVLIAGGSSVLAEAAVNALLNNLGVYLHHQGNTYDLGRAIEWCSPYGSASHRAANVFDFRPLPSDFKLEPNEEATIEFKVLEDIGGSALTASAVYELRMVFQATTYLRDSAVLKQ